MKVNVISCMLILAFVVFTDAKAKFEKPYEGHTVLKIYVGTKQQLSVIRHFQQDNDLDFWTEPRKVGVPVDIRVPPHKYQYVAEKLQQGNIKFRIIRENVQEDVDREMTRLAERYKNPAQFAFNINDFNTYDDIMQWMESIKNNCSSGVTCRTYSIGNSYEGRELKVLHMSTGAGKKGYWLDSAIHAREWLAPATLLKITDNLITNYNSDETVKRLVDTYDWYIIPSINPDGYIYSWTDERFWRKSRNINVDSGCIGTDLNRNYDSNWMHDGTSSDPCSDTYGGSSAASEPETQAVQNELQRLGKNLTALVTYHTAAQMWLHPYGHTDDATGDCAIAPDHDNLMRAANAAADAAENTGGLLWQRGNSCIVIYPVSGSTPSYAYGKAGIKYAYTPELRGPGFDPENIEIQPSYEENWAALVALVDEIAAIGGSSSTEDRE